MTLEDHKDDEFIYSNPKRCKEIYNDFKEYLEVKQIKIIDVVSVASLILVQAALYAELPKPHILSYISNLYETVFREFDEEKE